MYLHIGGHRCLKLEPPSRYRLVARRFHVVSEWYAHDRTEFEGAPIKEADPFLHPQLNLVSFRVPNAQWRVPNFPKVSETAQIRTKFG